MGVKVAKFGGSSVADALQIEKIRNIIENDGDIKYVVVSAPGKRFSEDSKVTDLLYLCKTHIEHKIPYEQIFQVICDRFMAVEVNLDVDIDLEHEFEEIKRNLEAGASADYIASRGEYLNAMIIASYLGYDFVDAAKIVKFDEKGRFMEELTDKAIKKELANHEKAVIPGFYGSKIDGSVKTFSRGGSDITGSIIARAVGADMYENWTDVSGFLMADPRIVKDPKPISTVSYKELRELSYMGASVLHEDAIYPARVANIPINIRNTNRPEDPGTIITAEPAKLEDGQIIAGIAGSKDFTVIAMYKNLMSSERGFIRKMTGILEDFDVPIEHIPSGIDTLSVVLENNVIDGRLDEIVEEFTRQLKPDTIEVFEDMALIATVGHGMSSRTGVSAALFTALAKEKINIRMIDQGSSEMNIIVGVENKDFEKAIKAIYEAFVS
ncbi:Aspartokinase I/homoserine dehydrogenase I [uncultured Eubacterium sp.]|uniref:aspartate kinase n=1 Tax=Brotomerdimonas butyrica TaxID=2981721 RepID=UPI000821FA0C|nr:aspartate kinase [Brotomerdimonas butyrica]MCU6755027.1 aspartate kinase [Brotomerdimonas butyrica]SCH07960.1 Aspartokinase I/homoserine dehydrogenase I [uncultured Eubacterium sp.]